MGKYRALLAWLTTRSYEAALKGYRAPPLLWSKGTGAFCDFGGPAWYRCANTESVQPASFFAEHYRGARGLVWLRLGTVARDNRVCDLDVFVKTALPTICEPFVLVTTDGDASVPSDLRADTVAALTSHPLLVAWYSQNCDGSNPAIRPFPIGLDLHTPRGFLGPSGKVAFLQSLRSEALPAPDRPLKFFCDVNVAWSHDRLEAVEALRGCGHVDFLAARISQRAIWRRYARYPLVLSAPGNGLDTHRTWELLYLGCIAVTRTSPLDPLYEGLPVAIVEDWREARDPGRLRRWVADLSPLTDAGYIAGRLTPDAYLAPMRRMLAATSPSSPAGPGSSPR